MRAISHSSRLFPVLFLLFSVMGQRAPSLELQAAHRASGAAMEKAFREGLDAYHARDYMRAAAIWLPAANAGHANSQSSIGYLYFEGLGVEQSDFTAFGWYWRAAARGEPQAQYYLGVILLREKGVPRDAANALYWCEKAINNGFPLAQKCKEDAARLISHSEALAAEKRARVEEPSPPPFI